VPALASPAQVVGYLALVLGVSAFLQREDSRLKVLIVAECTVYAAHFALLGHPPAAISALVTAGRTGLSIRWRARWLAAASGALTVLLAVAVGTHGRGWIPVFGATVGGAAMFLLHGVTLRLCLLVSTACWLVNDILSGSVGGTILETLVAMASISTIVRLALAARAAGRSTAQSAAS
jgi:hypothetical protein